MKKEKLDRLADERKASAGTPTKAAARVFVVFDTECDEDLYSLLRAQSKRPLSGFAVMGASDGLSHTEAGRASVRCKIQEADQTIVICGEHSGTSPSIHAEILLTIEAQKPYVLLWGRRDAMCTKPMGAAATKGMYSWTEQVLTDQIAANLREARKDAHTGRLGKGARGGGGSPSQP